MADKDYNIPAQTRIGHVHLKVSDLVRSLAFYRDLLGFELVTTYGDQAAFVSAGGYHHHIGLNTWHSKGAGPAPIIRRDYITLQFYILPEKILRQFLSAFPI